MKSTKFINLAAATLLLVGFTGAGCKRSPQGVTPLVNYRSGGAGVGDEGLGRPIGDDVTGSIPLSDATKDWLPAADQPAVLRDNIVYFDYDRATVRASETSKLDAIASFLKSGGNRVVRVEGHCDERGTEEYNRSLGERRALAVREYLARAGVDANTVNTLSHGEDRPTDPGRTQSAWSKNRRGEFVLLQPPSGVGASGAQ